MLNVDGLHEDFSAFTKPRTCCHNGHEVIKVTEQDENWVVTLKEGGKRPRDDAIEAEHAVILVVVVVGCKEVTMKPCWDQAKEVEVMTVTQSNHSLTNLIM